MEHHCPCLHQLEMQDKICIFFADGIFVHGNGLCFLCCFDGSAVILKISKVLFVYILQLFLSRRKRSYFISVTSHWVNIAGKVNEGFYHKTVCSVRVHGLSICSSHEASWFHSHCQIVNRSCSFSLCLLDLLMDYVQFST